MQQKGVPGMSATASNYITAKLLERGKREKEYFVIEYGAGYSTEFFIDHLTKSNVKATYVAVERDPSWYEEILTSFPGGELTKNEWSLQEYIRFVRSKPQNVWEVPSECARLEREQKKMRSLKKISEVFFKRKKFWFDAVYRAKINSVNFECAYICEPFKDQYGESPNKSKYIHIPLRGMEAALQSGKKCHAMVMIDGGPRADVVKEIFSLIDTHKNLTVDIFLLEAYRGYYQDIISSRPGGRFIAAGKNERLDGTQYLQEPTIQEKISPCIKLMGVIDVRDALARELWHFTNA